MEDLADVFEALVQHVLLMVLYHPLGQDRAAAAHDTGDAPGGERDVLDEDAGVDGHVIHALLGLLLDYFQHDARGQVFHAPHAGERLVNGHGADRHGRCIDDGLADARDVAAGRKVHHRVGAILDRVTELCKLFIDVRRNGRVAYVGVDLAFGRYPDAHRLEIRMVDVGWNNHAPARHLRPDELRRQILAPRDVFHLSGYGAPPRIVHLRADRIVAALCNPLSAHDGYPSAGVAAALRPQIARAAASTSCSSWASWLPSCRDPSISP